MATDFGFAASINKNGYYFVSYNTEDKTRIAEICNKLHSAGLDIWYDGGLSYDEYWDPVISTKIYNCKEYIFFLTKGIIEKAQKKQDEFGAEAIKKIYIKKEYDKADMYKKRKLIVYLDDISDETIIPPVIATWWQDNFSFSLNTNLQGIDARYLSSQETANEILKALGFKSYELQFKYDQEAAKSVIDAIEEFFSLPYPKGPCLKEVKNAYDNLTENQKKLVINYKELEEYEKGAKIGEAYARSVIERVESGKMSMEEARKIYLDLKKGREENVKGAF